INDLKNTLSAERTKVARFLKSSGVILILSFFFQAEDGIRAFHVTGVQTCALPIWRRVVAMPMTAPLMAWVIVSMKRLPREANQALAKRETAAHEIARGRVVVTQPQCHGGSEQCRERGLVQRAHQEALLETRGFAQPLHRSRDADQRGKLDVQVSRLEANQQHLPRGPAMCRQRLQPGEH